ncbi:MAG: hypothetical protein ABFD89_15465 [Bryobacteraceae bacterium]
MDDKEVNIAFRGTPEYRQMLQEAALAMGLKVKGLIEAAVASYLGKSVPKSEQDFSSHSDENRLILVESDKELRKWMKAVQVARKVKDQRMRRLYASVFGQLTLVAEVAEIERTRGDSDSSSTVGASPGIGNHKKFRKADAKEPGRPAGEGEGNPGPHPM